MGYLHARPPSGTPSADFDPVTLQVLWSRLIAVVDEAAATLVRTSFSTVVRESYDFSVVLTDADGNSLSQSQASIPSFIGTLPRTVQHFMREFPPDTLRPGDVFITNNPWLATGHLPDVSVARPIFRDGRLVAWAASVAHAPDIGGKMRSPDARDIYEEGVQIPPMYLARAGELDQTLLLLLRTNVRVPDQTLGDLMAQLSALEVAQRGLLRLMDEYSLDEVGPLAERIIGACERAMRAAIRDLPDGEYHGELQTDGLALPITLKMALTVAGDEIAIDFAGSSPQVERGINCVPAYRDAYTMYGLKCALTPTVPNNDGSFRPIRIHAPPGTVVSPIHPAPVGARVLIGHYMATLVFLTLAEALPEQVIAASGSPVWCLNQNGTDRKGRRFSTMFFHNGGMGASAHRDGGSCLTFPSNVSNTPVEVVEGQAAWRFERKELVPGSGGAGRFRGGLGQRMQLRSVAAGSMAISFLAERTRIAAPGLFGGGDGALGEVNLNGQPIDPKLSHVVQPGDLLEIVTPGGGGFGRPDEREARLAARDRELGYIE
jgi:N-methylhydantoinase B